MASKIPAGFAKPPAEQTVSNPRFDANPGKFCGAKNKHTGGPCMRLAGEQTDHKGFGRCFIHGGKTPAKSGRYSLQVASQGSLLDRINELKTDPTLYDLDFIIAYLKSLAERQIRNQSEAMQRYDELRAALENGDSTNVDEEEIVAELKSMLPEVDLSIINELGRATRNAFEMKFSKRFSIPLTEFEQILTQIATAFNMVADKWRLPPEAKQEFAQRVMRIRSSRPAIDPKLAHAGQDHQNGTATGPIIDGTSKEVVRR